MISNLIDIRRTSSSSRPNYIGTKVLKRPCTERTLGLSLHVNGAWQDISSGPNDKGQIQKSLCWPTRELLLKLGSLDFKMKPRIIKFHSKTGFGNSEWSPKGLGRGILKFDSHAQASFPGTMGSHPWWGSILELSMRTRDEELARNFLLFRYLLPA